MTTLSEFVRPATDFAGKTFAEHGQVQPMYRIVRKSGDRRSPGD